MTTAKQIQCGLVGWSNGSARATTEEELSFNMEYRLENRYSYTNEPKKRSLVKEWKSEEPKKE